MVAACRLSPLRALPGSCLAAGVALLVLACSSKKTPGPNEEDSAAAQAVEPAPSAVRSQLQDSVAQTQMRNVYFQVASDVTLRIRSLRGETFSKRSDSVIVFDERSSFELRIARAEIALSATDAGNLLGNHVFGYRGSPLSDLSLEIRDGALHLRGKMRKVIWIPFEMTAQPQVTSDGMIRVTPTRMRTFGINTLSFMKTFGLRLSRLIDVSGATGVRVDGNDLILDPLVILPPPRITGRLMALRIEGNELVQTFGADTTPPRLMPTGGEPANYMYFRGSTLRFGKLYMIDADMLIEDADPGDPFHFSLDEYKRQLVAGFTLNEPDCGLRVVMPDLGDAGQKKRPTRRTNPKYPIPQG